MGLFSKHRREEGSSGPFPPTPSPQYLNNQSQHQLSPSQTPYSQGISSSTGMLYGQAPSYGQNPAGQHQPPQVQYPSQQQYPPQQQYSPQPQYPQHLPSPSAQPNCATSPAAFPTPHPRILQITREGFTQRTATIHEADGSTPAYYLKNSQSADWSFSSSKPHIEITSAATGQIIGTVRFAMMSRTVELHVHGLPIALTSAGWMTRGYTFPSSSAGSLKWEASGMMGNAFACTTERTEWLAKCDQSTFSMRGRGTIEIVNRDLPQGLMDELVVTAVAMIELERRKAQQAAAAGS
ncbi:MAG: hypothetical protein Q9169_004960 [Polycauliona sp. 2 TL-2023]